MNPWLRTFVALALTSTITSHAVQAATRRPEPLAAFDIQISVQDDARPPAIKRPRYQFEVNVIPGSIFGTSLPESIVEGDFANGESMDLDLRRIESVVADRALPVDATPASAGISANPSEVRIARLGFFPRQGLDHRYVAEFWDSAAKSALMLVFVDRKCRVIGESVIDGVRYTFDLMAPKRGFYWVSASQHSPTEYDCRIVSVPDDDVVFRVWFHVPRRPADATT